MPASTRVSFHLALLGVSALVWLFVGMAMFTFGTVQPEEVGVLINNLWHTQETITQPGTYLYNEITSDLIIVDKSEQTIEFTNDPNRGDRMGRDGIRVKTRDGSDVDVDVTVNYAVDPEMAQVVLAQSGPSEEWGFVPPRRWEGYKSHWLRDYVRTICRYEIGELSTEEMYDSSLRTQKAQEAKTYLNELLQPRGIRINSVQVQAFNFYEEYQKKIREKKLADQEVEEEKSKRNAAEQEQKTLEIKATKDREVKVAEVEGELAKLKVKAEAEANQKRFAADAAFQKAERQAKALLYAAKKKAEGIRAARLAEAKGIEAFKEALASQKEGALNLVMMEYARRLKDIQFKGSPVQLESNLERFQHYDAAASRKGGR